jgi:hypothetical protein
VKNRFRNLPFKCNLQRYNVGLAAALRAMRSLLRPGEVAHGVALQAAYERQTLKSVFQLIGYRLWVLKALGYGF